ncbi:MAG: hypothetical protein Q9194_004528, partial [Teloschistes cf. exilis]
WRDVFEMVYAPAISLIKFALLLQYMRLLAPNRTINCTLFIGARAMIVIILVFYVIATFVQIFACSPREKIWNPLVTEGHCMNISAGGLITASFNMVSDFFIFVLPAKTFWNLQIPHSKKLRIVALFATGLV